MPRRRRLYLFGGSFNPPGLHHMTIVRFILSLLDRDHGDKLVIIPCGTRPDKETTNDIDPIHRSAMVHLAFGGIEGIEIDLSDLEGGAFTHTWDLEARYKCQYPDHSIVHVVGQDLIDGGRAGQSEIHRIWYRGAELFTSSNFLVLSRDDQQINVDDLPPHSLTGLGATGSSREIRAGAVARQSFEHLVSEAIASYMNRWHLYTGRFVQGQTLFQAKGPGLIYPIEPNPRRPWPEREERVRRLTQIARRVNADRSGNPDHLIVIGGDGWMLDMIFAEGQRRLPIVGLNAGTVGYLLNDADLGQLEQWLARGTYTVFREPLLYIQYVRPDGTRGKTYAFNEGFLRSATDGSGWMRVELDGDVLFDRLMGDGVMLATAAGSTGWSRNKGGLPAWIGAHHMVLTGDATTHGSNRWLSSLLEDNSVLSIDVLDPHKRPMRLVVDGKDQGVVSQVTLRRSAAHAAELAFFPEVAEQRRLERIRNG